MVKKRNNGEGALFKNSKGLWEARIELPPDPETGKRRRKFVTAKRQADALAKLKALQEELNTLGDIQTSSPKFKEWAMQVWIPGLLRQALKPHTIRGYESKLNLYLIPVLGELRLDKISPAHVRKVLAFVREKDLSSTTARHAYITLNKLLKDAYRQQLIPRNPCDFVDRPVPAVVEKPTLSPMQVKEILEATAGTQIGTIITLLLYTGARKEEALGLRVEDIDFNFGLIRFQWVLQRIAKKHGCGDKPCGKKRGADCPNGFYPIADGIKAKQISGGLWLTLPKSKTSQRAMPMAPGLAKVLFKHIKERGLVEGDFVFGTGGQPMRPEDFHEQIKDALGLIGVREEFSAHSFRHTASTLMDAAGVPESRRIAMLGHSSAQMTRHYTHTSMETLAADVDTYSSFIERS